MATAKKFDALREHYRPVVNIAVRQIIMVMGRRVHRVRRWRIITDCMAAVRPAVRPRHHVVYRLVQHILVQTLRAVEPQQSLQHAVPVKKAKQGIQTKKPPNGGFVNSTYVSSVPLIQHTQHIPRA